MPARTPRCARPPLQVLDRFLQRLDASGRRGDAERGGRRAGPGRCGAQPVASGRQPLDDRRDDGALPDHLRDLNLEYRRHVAHAHRHILSVYGLREGRTREQPAGNVPAGNVEGYSGPWTRVVDRSCGGAVPDPDCCLRTSRALLNIPKD